MCRALSILLIVGAFSLIHSGTVVSAKCKMPKDPDFIRVGETRFFIHHHNPDRTNVDKFSSYDEAKEICGKEHKMKMPKIDNLTTLVVVGRPLEKIVAKKKLRDTWYWLNAKYDEHKNRYYWQDNMQELSSANFHQRFPRPTGVGAHVDWHNVYLRNSTEPQCLSLTLPWPNTGDYGHSTSLGERGCNGKHHRHAMCESTDPACNPQLSSPYRVTEHTYDYFYDGNWIFGKRRFIANWKPRTKDEAVKYCKDLGLELYNPDPFNDACLIPFLKMWSREVTNSQWWSAWSYKASDSLYRNAAGDIVKNTDMNTALRMKFTEKSSKRDPSFCVAVSHEYEFSSTQHPCKAYGAKSDAKCQWHFVDFVPANCYNSHGTLCQHPDKDSEKRECDFRAGYAKNIHRALRETATEPFGWDQNKMLRRSRYKQIFGSLVCPKGYRMLRANNSEAWVKPKRQKPAWKYDLIESYWVIDKDGWKKTESGMCTISLPDSDDGWKRRHEQVPCNTWHFYLCEKVLVGINNKKVSGQQTKMSWDDREYQRLWPIGS